VTKEGGGAVKGSSGSNFIGREGLYEGVSEKSINLSKKVFKELKYHM